MKQNPIFVDSFGTLRAPWRYNGVIIFKSSLKYGPSEPRVTSKFGIKNRYLLEKKIKKIPTLTFKWGVQWDGTTIMF